MKESPVYRRHKSGLANDVVQPIYRTPLLPGAGKEGFIDVEDASFVRPDQRDIYESLEIFFISYNTLTVMPRKDLL